MDSGDDVYGAILADVLEGRPGTEIVERDDGFVMSFGSGYLIEPFARWSDPVERRAMRFVRGRVLDIGCGAGRVCLHLQEKGAEVVGIDSSPGAVRCSLERGVRDVRLLAVEDIDPSIGPFDTIVMLGQNFGLMRSLVGARRLLKRFARVTTARGRIVAETFDPHHGDDLSMRRYLERNRTRGRMPGQLRIRMRYRDLATPWEDWLQVSPGELEELLEGTDWKLSRRLGDGPSYVAIIDKR